MSRALQSDMKIRANDVVIIMMGLSGSGRSGFINALLQPSSPYIREVGNDGSLSACTKKVEHVVVDVGKEYRLVLVDTPGLDREDGPDSQVMRQIYSWASTWLPRGGCCGGIIFLYDICADRLQAGSEIEMLSKFFNISESSTQLVIATSKWGNLRGVPDAVRKGEKRHRDLGEQLKERSGSARFDKFKADGDAWKIVDRFVPQLQKAPRFNFVKTFGDITTQQVAKENAEIKAKSGWKKFFRSLAFWKSK